MRVALNIQLVKTPEIPDEGEQQVAVTEQISPGPIEIQTFTVETAPAGSGEDGEKLHFNCGNPDVQAIHGVMHIFKEVPKCSSSLVTDLVCMLAVPTTMRLEDLLSFLAPFTECIQGLRIIKGRSLNQYMVLVRFTSTDSAEEFYWEHHDKQYNCLEDALCHLAFVTNIEFANTEVHASLAAGPMIELPQCAVCLERMDEHTTGMLTVLCNHTFHCDCMSKQTTCPVCRYFAVPPEQSTHSCMVCGNTEGLWLCLICGYVGCGRYEGGHARGHFERTNHTYCMHVDQRCVWDYVGDNYVHRLVQNKADGKLVAIDSTGGYADEKLESLTLEYSYLLTQQLESQREYFEDKLTFVEQAAMERIVSVEEEVQTLLQKTEEYKESIGELEKEKKKYERKVEGLVTKLDLVTKNLNDEKELNKCLQENQKEWVSKVVSSKKELAQCQALHQTQVSELQEQIKDLMFHLQSVDTIANSDMKEDIQAGDLHVVQGDSPSSSKTSRKSPRKKK